MAKVENKQIEFAAQLVRELLKQGIVFQSPWLSPRQAAAYCGISESYINTLRSKGKGPQFKRLGEPQESKKGKNAGKAHNRVLYHKNWLDEWLRNGEPAM